MTKRISQYALDRKAGKKNGFAWEPDLEEWTKACGMYSKDIQIYEYFGICRETFYSFIDRERYIVENGALSAYLDSYARERKKTKEKISDAFFTNVSNGDVGSIIFGMKAYNGVIEARDIAHIELKKEEMELKRKQFLTSLAEKFNLNPEQLEKFAKEYFTTFEK